MNRRKSRSVAVAAIVIGLWSGRAFAKGGTETGAGSGVFPSGSTYNGVVLSTMRIGMGVQIASDGTASGDFETTLIGTSGGQARNIVVAGKPNQGSVPPNGPVTFSGLCAVDMGDGTAPLQSVPFSVSAVSGVNGAWSLTLSLGSSNLPAVTGSSGRISTGK